MLFTDTKSRPPIFLISQFAWALDTRRARQARKPASIFQRMRKKEGEEGGIVISQSLDMTLGEGSTSDNWIVQ